MLASSFALPPDLAAPIAAQMSSTVLVVDDEPHIRDVIRFALEKAGMRVVLAATGPEALARFDPAAIDLVVLDINLPDIDGLEVCRTIRRHASTPVLFVSARDEELDRILGLELGGDDYVTKPFSPRELVARVKVILRRMNGWSEAPSTPDKTLRHGRLELDPAQHTARWAGETVVLTATEFVILETLLERPQHVRDRNSLIAAAYDFDVHVSDRTVDSHIRHIRLKFRALGADRVIETVHGVGYKLGPCT